ncbi:hypothetical protein MPTK1_8g08620 [Marchantia polymorpha subsp. ruderalis]|uniref:Uncharacterized protein n=2 Tax=Marchantia polymorpha TaxID=3197 RepID=A0A176WKN6_MARPO|nr:hypothetical protein AXG93_4685s1020 [Marchantia polymorpha subsp. ruderalis]PTQ36513.1 hypothetical protein MARPO_0063s0057 [Marchantia polymorpha]BBN19199.1 hypothetical protein Mp_8g08620 [Marchantia polymorpha subsp. ruderalis]|eukprot:PTQ36513.1 hypothetical protein MARPO_0063s0057 [Marchantia polymorpha]
MTSESVYSGCQKSEALACETVESDCPPLQRVSCESIASSTSLERQLIRAAADVVLKAARDHWGKLSMSASCRASQLNEAETVFLARSDSECSSTQASIDRMRNRHFSKMQQLSREYLKELWPIYNNFKNESANKDHSQKVVETCRYHVDILKRMLVPMVAEKVQLNNWMTDKTMALLEKQIIHYVEKYQGEKFDRAFLQLSVGEVTEKRKRVENSSCPAPSPRIYSEIRNCSQIRGRKCISSRP